MLKHANRGWFLSKNPDGMPVPSDFELRQIEIPELGSGEVLVASKYLSLDPYMRLRLKGDTSLVGTLMVGDVVGEVIESRDPSFAPGDVGMGPIGWQGYGVVRAGDLRRVDPDAAPISTSLGILGMPGITAYFGLFEVGQPRAGDTVVVSAAAGAVGAVVGQLAKLSGCRVVGLAGSEEKIRYVVDELGFDAGINYKTEDVAACLRSACPDGIDVYWDNVGGALTATAVEWLALRGRVVICGQISQYNAAAPTTSRDVGSILLSKRARMEGFWVADFADRSAEALERLASWIRQGKLAYREDIVVGFENTPAAFINLLSGANFGKQLVQL